MAEKTCNLAKNGGGMSDTISTDERLVGIWYDGHPLYEKTFVDSNTGNLSTGLTGCYDAHIVGGFFKENTSPANDVPLNFYYNDSINGLTDIKADGSSIYMRVQGMSYTERVITIRYAR